MVNHDQLEAAASPVERFNSPNDSDRGHQMGRISESGRHPTPLDHHSIRQTMGRMDNLATKEGGKVKLKLKRNKQVADTRIKIIRVKLLARRNHSHTAIGAPSLPRTISRRHCRTCSSNSKRRCLSRDSCGPEPLKE